jgi:hypothetical protein
VELFADDSRLVAGLNRAAARLKAFGASVSAIGMKLATLGGAALAPMLGAAKMFGSTGDDLAKMSLRTGASVEALSQLGYAAAMADVDMDGLDKGLRKMQKFLDAAATGSGEARESLARLGLTAANLAGLAPDKQFELLADRLDKVADPAAKAALAMKVFGREGTSLIPLMAGGAAGIEALRKRAGELGLTISTQAAAGAMKFHDALKTLWAVTRRAGFAIGESLAPVLGKLAEDMTAAAVQANAFIQNNRELLVTALKVAASVTAAGVALVGLGKVVGVASVGLRVVAAIIAALGSPVVLAVSALAALGGALAYACLSGKNFAEKMAGLKDLVVPAVKAATDFIASAWQSVVAAVGPIIKTFVASVSVAFATLRDAVAGPMGEARDLIVSAWNYVGGYVGPVLSWLQDAVIGAFSAITFALKNWRAMMEYAFVSAVYNVVRFANQVQYFFTDVIPATLRWFAGNWRDIFQTIWNGTKTFATNIWTNLKNLCLAIKDFATGSGWNFQWTGLLEGFESTIKELPAIAARQIGPLEAELAGHLDDLGKDLSDKWQKHDTEFRAAVAGKLETQAPDGQAVSAAADSIDTALSRFADVEDGLGAAVEKAAIGAAGTFNAANLLGLQAGDADDRIANAAEKTAKGIDGLRQDVRNNRATFT